MLVSGSVGQLNRPVRRSGELHEAGACSSNRAVRKEHYREKNNQPTHPAGLHFQRQLDARIAFTERENHPNSGF
ncbi:MAG: hypothetical protein HY661_22740 [Betaproteobacteria bacterium]|nr:hypothetical protein [Betaproteobacteria bacterium]